VNVFQTLQPRISEARGTVRNALWCPRAVTLSTKIPVGMSTVSVRIAQVQMRLTHALLYKHKHEYASGKIQNSFTPSQKVRSLRTGRLARATEQPQYVDAC